MPQIGPLEILMVAAIALIVFGPQKLPEMARSVGKAISELRRMATDVRAEFEAELSVPEEDRVRPAPDRPPPDRLTPPAGESGEPPERAAPDEGGEAEQRGGAPSSGEA